MSSSGVPGSGSGPLRRVLLAWASGGGHGSCWWEARNKFWLLVGPLPNARALGSESLWTGHCMAVPAGGSAHVYKAQEVDRSLGDWSGTSSLFKHQFLVNDCQLFWNPTHPKSDLPGTTEVSAWGSPGHPFSSGCQLLTIHHDPHLTSRTFSVKSALVCPLIPRKEQ